ncbi:DUF697 domain-containing protein [Methylomonas sp. SURF-2]|uniref:DUF697 domain-containing protein n=1 Tax=Methylomonas subterranea TaxID=2952225 RepID=A0ABT1TG89_9GAMM|nr:DUF697 domain-containing protein [Methylomonas sp. SURF-2]MCQ8104445.1 DUF697 domain-containing protein [Methylomonas sp. SURF-2]
MINKLLHGEWIHRILNPAVSEIQLHAKLQQARQNMPMPVFWLLGKTQSGKSSVIQALTGSSRAEIGQGFRACTRQSAVYDFPNEDSAFLRFLDTKGLGEADYDPSEDMAWCRSQAHLLMVVVKAMDHELDGVLSATRTIRAVHPEWPVLVIQTCLHEGYPSKASNHPQPYPFAEDRLDMRCPADLARSISVQRQHFKALGAQFVAVDLTRVEDGYQPVHYGLEALWEAIEAALPLGLRHMLLQNRLQSGQLNDVYAQHAYPHVMGYAVSAGLLAMTPVPAAGMPLVIALQGKMFHSIASIYGLSLTKRSVYEVVSAVGVGGIGIGFGARELAKLIPGWGSLISGLSTAAITYALGMTLCFYYAQTQQGHAFSAKMLKTVYQEQLQCGRELLKARFTQNPGS